MCVVNTVGDGGVGAEDDVDCAGSTSVYAGGGEEGFCDMDISVCSSSSRCVSYGMYEGVAEVLAAADSTQRRRQAIGLAPRMLTAAIVLIPSNHLRNLNYYSP